MKFVCCEAGVAFHGLIEATQMVFKAKEAGANAIKFQLYDNKVIEQVPEKWRKHLKKVQLNKGGAYALMRAGEKAGIEVFFTPMFLEAVDWCEDLGVKRYKIRANDAYNMDLLFAVRKTNKPCYVSRNNIDGIDPIKQRGFYTIYYDKKRPTKYNEVFAGYSNLLRSDGYSSHCEKLYAIMQVMVFGGVDYIEVHCTLDSKDTTLLTRWRDILNNNIVNKAQRGKYELA